MDEIAAENETLMDYKVNNFSFLHWLGNSFVVLGHQYNLMGMGAPRILGLECHNLGLKILFVVSGYLVMESFRRTGNTRKWLIKRFVRIWTGLLICIVGMIILIGPFFTTMPLTEYFIYCKKFFISNLMMNPVYDLPGVFTNNIYPVAANGSLWSLPVEVFCYLVLPLIVFTANLFKKINKKIAYIFVLILCAALYTMSVLREGGIITSYLVCWGTEWMTAFTIIIYFVLGAVYSWYGKKENLKLQWAILLVTVYMCIPGMLNVVVRPVVIAYFVLALAFDRPPLLDKITKNLKGYYAFYLWSFPIQQALIAIFVVKMNLISNPLILFVCAYMIILLAASFITKYIEEPISKGLLSKLQ